MLAVQMPKPSPTATGGRYSMKRVSLNIEQMRTRLGLSQKECADGVGMTEATFSKKINLKGSSFSVPELGRIADYFAHIAGRRLPGFPFLDPDLVDILEDATSRHKR